MTKSELKQVHDVLVGCEYGRESGVKECETCETGITNSCIYCSHDEVPKERGIQRHFELCPLAEALEILRKELEA